MLTKSQVEFLKLLETPDGVLMDDSLLLAGLQDLIDTGSIWSIPECYLNLAADFILDGSLYPYIQKEDLM